MEKAKILIVEDEAIIAMEIESQLQSLGYEVTSIVNNGADAIKKAEVDNPDLILMDIRIKGVMDGIEAAEVIRNRFGIPVIFSTAYLDEGRIERAKITMPFGYVLKPIQERDLKGTIEMALYVSKIDDDRRKIEERFKLMMHQSPSVVELYNVEGLQIEVNNAYEELWGFPASHTVNDFNVLKSQEVIDTGLRKYVDRAYKGETVIVPPYQYDPRGETEARGEGRIRWLSTRIYPLISNDIVTNIVIMHEDVTEKKELEESLIISEKKYKVLFEDSIDGYVLADPETGIILDCNTVMADLVSRTKEEIIGQSQRIFHPVIDPETKFSPTFQKHKTVNQGERIETQIITKSGELKDVVILADIFELEGKEVVYGIFRNITERKKTEADLRESEEKHRTLFETMTQGVVYQNAEGIITDANPAAERILGLSLNQMQGKTSMDPGWKTIHENGSDFPGDTHPISVALKTGKTIKNVIQGVFHPDKKEHRWININAVPKFRKGESIPYEAYAIFHDITDLKTEKK